MLIQDVVPPPSPKFGSIESRVPTTEEMIEWLYIRGVSIEDIFGRYYAFDANNSEAPVLTVGDAQLVYGYEKPPQLCKHGRMHYCSVKECKLNW